MKVKGRQPSTARHIRSPGNIQFHNYPSTFEQVSKDRLLQMPREGSISTIRNEVYVPNTSQGACQPRHVLHTLTHKTTTSLKQQSLKQPSPHARPQSPFLFSKYPLQRMQKQGTSQGEYPKQTRQYLLKYNSSWNTNHADESNNKKKRTVRYLRRYIVLSTKGISNYYTRVNCSSESNNMLEYVCMPKYHKLSQAGLQYSQFRTLGTLQSGYYWTSYKAIYLPAYFVCVLRVVSKEKAQAENAVEQIAESLRIHLSLTAKRIPGISRCFGCFEDRYSFYVVEYYVINAQGSFGTRKTQKLDYKYAKKWLKAILLTVKGIHSYNCILRCLYMQSMVNCFGLLKITDLSACALLTGERRRQTFCGRLELSPPELIEEGSYDYSIDIWVIGVILYELVSGLKPFPRAIGLSASCQLDPASISYPIHFSWQLVSLLNEIFADKKNRISSDGLLNHVFLAGEAYELIRRETWNDWLHFMQ